LVIINNWIKITTTKEKAEEKPAEIPENASTEDGKKKKKKKNKKKTKKRKYIYIYIEFINTNKKNIIYMVVINKIVIKYIY